MRTMTVASLNILTGGIDVANCTTDTTDLGTFIGDMKSKLHIPSLDALGKLRKTKLNLRCFYL